MVVVIYYPGFKPHLALALTGLGEKNIYISFYPRNGASTAEFRLRSLKSDQLSYGIDTINILPSEESCGYGLSEAAILNWWKTEFNPKQESFGWFSNNCSSMVYRALCAGQKGSNSLENKAIPKSPGFCMPRKILNYAIELGKKIFNKFALDNKQKELQDQFKHLKECCNHHRYICPFDQMISLYTRIKNLNTSEYSLVVNKPFCDGVQKVLRSVRDQLDKKNIKYSEMNFLHSMIPITDIDSAFNYLNQLDFFLHANKLQDEIKLLQSEITKSLLKPVFNYIKKIDIAELREQERIKHLFKTQLSQTIEKNNPHAEHFQKKEIPDCTRAYAYVGIGGLGRV